MWPNGDSVWMAPGMLLCRAWDLPAEIWSHVVPKADHRI